MFGLWNEAVAHAQTYAANRGLQLRQELGRGYDGIVFATDRQTAIKSLRYERLFQRERDVYLRLRQHGIIEIHGCNVPQLVDWDETLWVVETEIVKPPFVLDFAGAYLDEKPDFPKSVMARWQREKRQQFGANWDRVQSIMANLRRYGIYLADVKPGNISFE